MRLVNGMINRSVTLDKLKELGVKCPYNDLAEKHWGYCGLMEATVPHSAEEWHGLSYHDGKYNIIIEKFVDSGGRELAETVTTAGRPRLPPGPFPPMSTAAISARSPINTRTGMQSPPSKKTANVKTANVGDTLTYTVKLSNDKAASSAWKEVAYGYTTEWADIHRWQRVRR